MGLYTAPSDNFSNVNLSALASQYAADFNHDESNLIQRLTNKMIFDAAPKQFFDLKLLNMTDFGQVTSDEFFYDEAGFQREAITATATAAAVTSPTKQTYAVSALDTVNVDLIISYPNNKKGTITNVNGSTKEITVAPMKGDSLPAVSISDEFAIGSTVEGDAVEGFSSYFRLKLTERFNFIQMMSRAVRFGRMELFKYQNQGTFDGYVGKTRSEMFRQFRLDISNILWNGTRGEIVLADGKLAKTAGGAFPTMVEAGSPNASATKATIKEAFEDVVLESEFGEYGDTRFAFMPNRHHLELSKAYKDEKTRYTPNDSIANLMLDQVQLGSSNIVLVPFNRFTDRASFPAAFGDRIMIMDMKNIKAMQTWGETSGDTLDREDGIAKTYKDMWVESTFSLQFFNPLACGYVDVPL